MSLLKQTLEESLHRTDTIIHDASDPDSEPDGRIKKRGELKTLYTINGIEVDEEIFRQEQNRICLFTTTIKDKYLNAVDSGGSHPEELYNRKKMTTTQYLLLPFYKNRNVEPLELEFSPIWKDPF